MLWDGVRGWVGGGVRLSEFELLMDGRGEFYERYK
jgi:hypothetical protein